jgi:DHA1 family bicyclomycin/chloramphenicol resistance-like MFS transporter
MEVQGDAGTSSAFVGLLVALSVQNLIAINLIIPGLPALSGQLGVSAGAAKLVMPMFFVPYAVSLLTCGPLSDWYGRRPVLLFSLSIFLLGSIVCAVAGSLPQLLCGRILQGAGAGGGTVMALAVARDCFGGPAFVRTVSYINASRSLVPALAPVVGGLLVEQFGGWRPPFIATALLGFILSCLCLTLLRETLREKRRSASIFQIMFDYVPLLTSRQFLSPGLMGAFAFGAWFAYVVGSPAVLIAKLKVSPALYGLYHGIIVTACIAGSLIVGRLAGRLSSRQATFWGLVLLCGGSLLTATLTISGIVTVASVVIPMAAVSFGYGIVFSASSAQAMMVFADRAGSSFALIGFMSMIIATLGTICVSLMPGEPATAFSTVMAVFALCSACASTLLPSRHCLV